MARNCCPHLPVSMLVDNHLLFWIYHSVVSSIEKIMLVFTNISLYNIFYSTLKFLLFWPVVFWCQYIFSPFRLNYIRQANNFINIIPLRKYPVICVLHFLTYDLFQPKTDLFSTRALIWVHFKTVRYFPQPICILFSY